MFDQACRDHPVTERELRPQHCELDGDAARVLVPEHMSSAFGLTYFAVDRSGIPQLFSSTRGQMSRFTSPFITAVGSNDLGDFVYVEHNRLFASDGRLLINDVVGAPAMNNAGDIVFNESVSLTITQSCRLPWRRAIRRPFKTMDLFTVGRSRHRGISTAAYVSREPLQRTPPRRSRGSSKG